MMDPNIDNDPDTRGTIESALSRRRSNSVGDIPVIVIAIIHPNVKKFLRKVVFVGSFIYVMVTPSNQEHCLHKCRITLVVREYILGVHRFSKHQQESAYICEHLLLSANGVVHAESA